MNIASKTGNVSVPYWKNRNERTAIRIGVVWEVNRVSVDDIDPKRVTASSKLRIVVGIKVSVISTLDVWWNEKKDKANYFEEKEEGITKVSNFLVSNRWML